MYWLVPWVLIQSFFLSVWAVLVQVRAVTILFLEFWQRYSCRDETSHFWVCGHFGWQFNQSKLSGGDWFRLHSRWVLLYWREIQVIKNSLIFFFTFFLLHFDSSPSESVEVIPEEQDENSVADDTMSYTSISESTSTTVLDTAFSVLIKPQKMLKDTYIRLGYQW